MVVESYLLKLTSSEINTGGCSTLSITANGGTAGNTGNDGAGGGGAAGSIIFDVVTFNVSGACAMTVSANGGNGGDVGDATAHAGGGGGAQGRVIYRNATQTNITTDTNNGTAGCNNSGCGSVAGSPSGTNDSGISNNEGATPLPVSLLYFNGAFNKESGKIDLKWATATEDNNEYFTLERSSDGIDFSPLKQVPGNGTTSIVSKYSYEDGAVYEKFYYYRLSQTDLDGTSKMLKVIRVERNGEGMPDVWIYPNPVKQSGKITLDFIQLPPGLYTVTIQNSQGVELSKKQIEVSNAFQVAEIESNGLASGLYTIRISSSKAALYRKVIVQ